MSLLKFVNKCHYIYFALYIIDKLVYLVSFGIIRYALFWFDTESQSCINVPAMMHLMLGMGVGGVGLNLMLVCVKTSYWSYHYKT